MDERYTGFTYHCGPNDGGVKRGDRADTGDNEARPTATASRGGSGARAGSGGATGAPTADPSSLSESTSSVGTDVPEDLQDLEIVDADDPALGLGHGEEG